MKMSNFFSLSLSVFVRSFIAVERNRSRSTNSEQYTKIGDNSINHRERKKQRIYIMKYRIEFQSHSFALQLCLCTLKWSEINIYFHNFHWIEESRVVSWWLRYTHTDSLLLSSVSCRFIFYSWLSYSLGRCCFFLSLSLHLSNFIEAKFSFVRSSLVAVIFFFNFAIQNDDARSTHTTAKRISFAFLFFSSSSAARMCQFQVVSNVFLFCSLPLTLDRTCIWRVSP